MNPSMRTGLLVLCSLVCGNARRVSVSKHYNSAKVAAAELATYIQSLDEGEPHHVCVTGNQAAQAVDSFVLQGTGESRADLPLTSLISEESCTVQEALVGNTLFTINPDLSDHCAARWKANSLTCDVLFHAHSGSDAEELYKFRLMTENFDCDAAMIVVHDSPDMPANFESKMNEHAKVFPGHGCTQAPTWINAKSRSAGGDVTQAFKDALDINTEMIREQLKLESENQGSSFLQGARRAGEEKASHLRRRLHEILSHRAPIVNVQQDLLKALWKQGAAGKNSFMQEGEAALVVDNGSG